MHKCSKITQVSYQELAENLQPRAYLPTEQSLHNCTGAPEGAIQYDWHVTKNGIQLIACSQMAEKHELRVCVSVQRLR